MDCMLGIVVRVPVFALVCLICPRSVRLAAVPTKLYCKLSKPLAGLAVTVKVTVSPSSTCRPGQVVSRSPLRLSLVPQLARVQPQFAVAEMVRVCATAGVDAKAVKASAASAARRRPTLPPEVRERWLPHPLPSRAHGGGGGIQSQPSPKSAHQLLDNFVELPDLRDCRCCSHPSCPRNCRRPMRVGPTWVAGGRNPHLLEPRE